MHISTAASSSLRASALPALALDQSFSAPPIRTPGACHEKNCPPAKNYPRTKSGNEVRANKCPPLPDFVPRRFDRTTMMAYKRQLPAPAGVKLRNGLRASVRRRSCGAGMSVLDGEAVPRWLHGDEEASDTTKGEEVCSHAYPHVESLQSTTLGEVLAFEPVSSEFVQVLNASFTLTLGDYQTLGANLVV